MNGREYDQRQEATELQQSSDSRLTEDADIGAATSDTRSDVKNLLGIPAQDRAFIEQFRTSGMPPDEIGELYDQLHPAKIYADPALQRQADETRSRVLEYIRAGRETAPNKLTEDEVRLIGLEAARFLKGDPSATFMALRYEEGENGEMIDLRIDPDVGQRFDGHGIRKGNEEQQLRSLMAFLDTGIDPDRPFHSGPLELPSEKRSPGMGTTGGTVDKETSGFIILGDIDKSLNDGIKHVIVTPAYHAHIERLRSAYPQVNFIASNEANTVLKAIADHKPT